MLIRFEFAANFGKQAFTSGKSWVRSLTKNLTAEVELHRTNLGNLSMCFRFSTRCDHAGLTLDLSALSWNFVLNIVDNRHWDYQNDCWEKYDDKDVSVI